MSELKKHFLNLENYSTKWEKYFDVYENLLSKYKNKNIIFIEIGVFNGGSLNLWKKYFGKNSRIIGIDINKKCKQFEDKKNNIEVFIGNQSDENFWENFFKKVGEVDIILDDGGHTNFQQIMTTCCTVPNIKDEGLLVVEDVFHSYGVSYGSKGFFNPSKYSFINFCKKTIDDINFRFPEGKKFKFSLNKFIYSIEFFESIVAFYIDKKLCESQNEVIYSKGKNLNVKDYTHMHDEKIPGSSKFVIKLKKILKSFRGNLKYIVFKINEHISKKYFK